MRSLGVIVNLFVDRSNKLNETRSSWIDLLLGSDQLTELAGELNRLTAETIFRGHPPWGRIYGGSHIPSAIAAPCEDCLGKIFGGKNFSEFGYRGGVARNFSEFFLEGWSWRKLSEMGLSGGKGKNFSNKFFREIFLVGVLRDKRIVIKNFFSKIFST